MASVRGWQQKQVAQSLPGAGPGAGRNLPSATNGRVVFQSLRRAEEFRNVMQNGRRWDEGIIRGYVQVGASPLPAVCVGIVVPAREHGAVTRNRLRRLVREALRVELPAVCAAVDSASVEAKMVLRVRTSRDPRRLGLSDIQPAIVRLCGRLVRLVAQGSL